MTTKTKKIILFILFALAGIFLTLLISGEVYPADPPAAVNLLEVDCVKRLIQGNDSIHVIRVQDPENTFVSIFFTTIDSGQVFALADPSNTAIAARLTGKIPVDQKGNRIINKTTNLDIAHIRKSIGSKVMKIARVYDKEMDTLVYLIYTTKLLDGSLKHSLSVVPLGNPLKP